MWNRGNATLVHIDVLPAYEERNYTPDIELVGDIAATLNKLTGRISHKLVLTPQAAEILTDRQHQRELLDRRGAQLNQFALHPLRIVRAMQDIVNSDVTLTVDMGSFHIWIARYLYSFRARQVMISNGQQTMGVALPWAIGAWLVNPQRKVVSVSGDGGFLQSSMELETAVRLRANILHIIWVDNGYNMVAIQEQKNISASPAWSSARLISKPTPNPSGQRLFGGERRRAGADAACRHGRRWPGGGRHSGRLSR
jgi:acetolactate synthase-1/2/3 large subunit